MKLQHITTFCLLAVVIMSLIACDAKPGKNDPGREYMPDMYHSLAYEANYYDYYSYNTWGDDTSYYRLAKPRKPMDGTVPRGYAGMMHTAADSMDTRHGMTMNQMRGVGYTGVATPVNGSVHYPYANTDTGRAMATAEIIDNPFPITTNGLAKGKELYEIYCGICHGNKGNGMGYLVNEDENKNVKYLAAPANFLTEDLSNSSNGRYYHSIMYGKGVMGAYNGKLSFEERWQVIHHIRNLQAKELKKEYSGTANTLNAAFGTPGDEMQKQMAENTMMPGVEWEAYEGHGGHHGGEHHEDDHHDEDHQHDEGDDHGDEDHKNEEHSDDHH